MLISTDESDRDESDRLLDRAIWAASAEPIPVDTLDRVIETAIGYPAPDEREGSRLPVLERMLNMVRTHRRLSATAATVACAALILAGLLVGPPNRAYGLEKTAKALEGVRSYHARITPAKRLSAIWVELNPDGTPRRVRADFHTLDDGAKVVILSEGRSEVWFLDKNAHLIVPAEDSARTMSDLRDLADPRLFFDRLQKDEASGKLQVETRLPVRDGEPLVLIATDTRNPDRRYVYEIDSRTRLVQRYLVQVRKRGTGNDWDLMEERQFLDYNKPIDSEVFLPRMPKDVIHLDQVRRPPGIVRGELTEEEVATKAVRDYFEAIIAGNDDRAGLIYEGYSAEDMKRIRDRSGEKILRVIEIGKPVPWPINGPKALAVPVKLEVEKQGVRRERSARTVVRPEQPDRWAICGGI
ncbi:hypothetical protein [Aquisphaera insulae]|uniref:hypothetical protein n=1 Tax=Aquisphaera insulae TaxID=2712864 RepID=UPI0013EC2645|nr:hypothetical protein [Aquisphaera insulae]